jgi:hypothetical protein
VGVETVSNPHPGFVILSAAKNLLFAGSAKKMIPGLNAEC